VCLKLSLGRNYFSAFFLYIQLFCVNCLDARGLLIWQSHLDELVTRPDAHPRVIKPDFSPAAARHFSLI
jgi:hypothetical protein